jgi:hypothetical protein
MEIVQRVFRIIAVVYLAAVVVLVVAGMDFAGSINSRWIEWLILITMPLSSVSLVGTWALIHGADLPYFAAFYFACATINVWLASRVLRTVRLRVSARPSNTRLGSSTSQRHS